MKRRTGAGLRGAGEVPRRSSVPWQWGCVCLLEALNLGLRGVRGPPAGRPTVNSSSSAFLLWEPQGSVPAYPSHKTSPTQEPRHLTLAPSALTSGSSRGQRPAGLLSVLAPACWVSKDEGNASLCPGELGALRTWQGASGGPAPRGSGHVGFRRPGTLFGLLS